MASFRFLKTAIKDYKVGAVTRTSKFAVSRILANIKPEYKYFMEYGPGDGVVTKEILKAMPKDGKYIAIELNDEFVEQLKEIKDERLTVIKGDIVEYSKKLDTLGLPKIDFVLSSIPFTILSPKTRVEVIQNTHGAIRKGGRLMIFQYSFLVRPIIKKLFGNVKSLIEFRNFPPYCMMTAEKV